MPTFPRGGSAWTNAPQIVVAQLLAGGGLEGVHLHGLGVQGGKHVLDQAILARGVPGLNGDHQPLGAAA